MAGDPDESFNRCEFDKNYDFELVDPNGNVVGTDVVPAGVELAYMTRSKRVLSPTPGRWTMRALGGAPCVAGNTGSYYVPQVAMLALTRNPVVRARINLEKTSIASNERLRVTALLQTGVSTAAKNITVSAKLVNGATQLSVPMYDDGINGGDETAGDGLYSALINSTCSATNLTPGGYRFVVEFQSDAATAQPVVLPNADVQDALGINPNTKEPAISASLVAEKLLTVRACGSSAPGCGGAASPPSLCPAQQATISGPVNVAPGETRKDISVTIKNCPIAGQGVTVGVGPGVTTSNVRSTYNDATGTGTVIFDATAASDAPVSVQPLSIFWGPLKCDTSGATIPVCRPLPAVLTAANYSSCGTSAAQTVRLTKPTIDQSCVPNPTLSAVVLSRNGVALNPPRSVAANGDVSLDPGIYVVEWTVSGSGTPQKSQQAVNVSPAFAASGTFWVRDRARVKASSTQYAAISNAGSTETKIGADAHAGDLLSVANVVLQDRATVHGLIRTADTLTRQNQTTVTGTITQNTSVKLASIANPPVTFPVPAGADVTLALNEVGSRTPGNYGNVMLNRGARLTFTAGEYLLSSLDLEPDSRLIVAPGTRLFVKNSLIYRGLFTNAAGQLASTFVGYYGTAAAVLESNFSGTFLAQSASVALGDADSLTYSGTVLAKDIEVRPDVTLSCALGASQPLARVHTVTPESDEGTDGATASQLANADANANANADADATNELAEAPSGNAARDLAPSCTLGRSPSDRSSAAWLALALTALTIRRRRARS